MFKLVLVSALLAVAYGFPRIAYPRLDGRIVGGDDTTIEENPYQVSLQTFARHKCGGAIISEKYVVTAAHCVDGAALDIMTIRAGSTNRANGGVVIHVDKVHIHSQYDNIFFDYDIAILELIEPLTLSSTIAAITLPKKDETVKTGDDAVCTGWGVFSEWNSGLPLTLQSVTVQIISDEYCNDAYDGEITDRMVCAAVNGGGKDACQGDSGGPLVVDGKFAGIVSWGLGCGRANYPGVYSNVANLRDFITEVTGI